MLNKAAKAVRDGYSASMASIVSVFMLMWLRTTLSYQFVHGVSMVEAMSLLYAQGGIPRFYRGLLPGEYTISIIVISFMTNYKIPNFI